MRKAVSSVGALVLSLLLIPSVISATDQELRWRIGSEFTYVNIIEDQETESIMTVQKPEDVEGHLCWKVEVSYQDDIAYTWYDKDSMGVWKTSSKFMGMAMDSIWGPQPGNKILPIGDRSYDTKVKVEIGGEQIGEYVVHFEIVNRGLEEITVPAGTFSAYHLVIEQTADVEGQPTTSIMEFWYSTEVSNMVKSIVEVMGSIATTALKSYVL
jgi:hypothetical protein